ncbi:MAG: hypothetical protein A3B99_04455 [Candidatus Yanofskybacteria bacterium RIFCSPHIGHO2_02_FULL_44_12b]|uniref:NAD kinase n=1 Tax=Candidatus Yanofskybacteria bacterium RIFCSPLOWO2_01_FULL_44_22 TaxID=1802697 RepID=A0A1F8GJY8_9BACT|nr:MAG: hypothetical protein A2659_03070 [Candidatus Yanofskybacteria bacterium RIFCSPHIGHO2_01_FULL_44_24]OGN14431.1 MAG: hypothetical protein A3B99_04455 [Candidatus Yanofskybacteria bacterium RIFCSPHIGHO2_02_FULL_44_12b]OGN25712.1 MAG: hypothetical protein A2925_00800 [Candidatus Yanofskybacteria bacterium RIFCSPLOWO2_01_FULL_44_22]
MNSQIKSIHIFYHSANKQASLWAKKIKTWLRKEYPHVKLADKDPAVVLILGGDGSILEAVAKYGGKGSMIFGLNMGKIGFLASVREEERFIDSLRAVLEGKFNTIERMMLRTAVKRSGKTVFHSEALNEVVVKNPLGMVELRADVGDHPVQHVRGTGIMISTATGSTAYNLSAHGPIVMPDIKCMIITELLDHDIPTPSVVVKYTNELSINVINFKNRGLLSISKTKKAFDVLLVTDGETIFPLKKNDIIIVKSSPKLIKFVQLEDNYFFRSLKEKFRFN